MISLILPVHGKCPYLIHALKSIRPEIDKRIELIIVLDRVDSGTASEIMSFAELQEQVRIVESEQPGISSALNKGIAVSRGKFIARIDADDEIINGRLAKQEAYLLSKPNLAAVGCQAIYIDMNGNQIGHSKLPIFKWQIDLELEVWNPLIHPGMMYRKDAIVACGGYDPKVDFAEDFDLARKLRRHGGISNLNFYGLKYRRHVQQISNTRITERTEVIAKLLAKDANSRLFHKQIAFLTSHLQNKFGFFAVLVLLFISRPFLALGIFASQIVTLVGTSRLLLNYPKTLGNVK